MNNDENNEETAALARAIEASLQDEVARKSRALAEEIMQRSLLEDADRQLAQALDAEQHQLDQTEADTRDRKEAEDALHRTLEASQQLRSEERHEGSWDCIACTYTNLPYRPKCEACAGQPPQHVLVFREMPPTLRFGLELEIIVPHGTRDGFTLESIADQLTKLGPPVVQYVGYTHQTTDYWKIVTDASLQGSHRDDLCFELVSPVLQGERGLASLRALMEHTRRMGIATNSSCSFHVHVDAEGELGSLQRLQNIAQSAVSLENAFDLLVSLSWEAMAGDRRANRNQYCKSNRLAFGERSNRQRCDYIVDSQSKQELVDMINPDRYYKLNMTNIVKPSRPSTIEFRHHGGVVDMREAEAWVRLLVLFSHQATGDLCLPESSTPESELRALFDLVNCPGLEQFFTMERRLYANHRLRNEWECSVCRRKFRTSRQLAQHVAARGH